MDDEARCDEIEVVEGLGERNQMGDDEDMKESGGYILIRMA